MDSEDVYARGYFTLCVLMYSPLAYVNQSKAVVTILTENKRDLEEIRKRRGN
jgi:hypothetical protein